MGKQWRRERDGSPSGPLEPHQALNTLLDLEPIRDGAGMQTSGRQPLRVRFGDVAVSLGYAGRRDVEAALAVQRLDQAGGRAHRLLGQILVDLKLMTHTQVSQVLGVLVRESLQDRSGRVVRTLGKVG